jgi:MFS family permease
LAQAASSEASSSSQPLSQGSPDEGASSPNGWEMLNDRAQSTIDSILYPVDSYTRDTRTYWADLPFWQKTRWINKQSNEEARRELKVIGQMFKQDPLSPIRSYFSNYVVTGMGLLVEGYVLFSVGNLGTLFKLVWPQCWKTHETCDHGWIIAIDALQITGIIFGQILVGIEGDWIGRRFGMVQDALVLTLGTVMLTAMWGTTLNGWLICYAISLFVYGVGVGGEYPMTSTRAMEGSGTGFAASTGDRMHRGRKVALAFTMQGWGQLLNQGILLICLLIFHGSLDAPFSKVSTQYTFRVSFGVIILPTLYLAYLRFYKMKYADQALKDAKGRSNTSGYSWKTLKMASSHYWHRMVGTAIVWFINDVLFYGSKIFSGVFIGRITGGSAGATLKTTWLYNLLNVGISLIGYYLGALLIDHKQYGRKWMQINGLLFIGVVFAICAAQWETFIKPGAGTRAFMGLYFLSSFFTQFGPNVTSFLLAAELYPALVRSTAHGVSAAAGKCGALLAAVLYNYIDDRTKFFVVFPFGFAGALLTLVFVADSTGLDLREQERYYQYVIEGREHEYHGVAVHPRHLSLWERVVLKRHLAYDADKDRVQKLAELKSLYQSIKSDEVIDEKAGGQGKGKQSHLSEDQQMLADYELDNFFANEEKLQGYLTRKSGTRTTSKPHPSRLAEIEGKFK